MIETGSQLASRGISGVLQGDTKLGGKDDFAHLLFRPEIRYDRASTNFFGGGFKLSTKDHQFTAGIGLVAYFQAARFGRATAHCWHA